jgi:superfamily II DNA or RNA helicase
MSALREYVLSNAYESVVAKANFRRPQHEAFEKFHQLMRAIGRDLPSMNQQEVADRISNLGYSSEVPADLLFDLATGIGKTRLLGGILVYLARARQTRNCLLLAPRVAILDKLRRESDPTSTKYLFIDRSLVSNPNICFRSDLLSFEPDPTRLNVFVLSPQTITGDDRKFATSGDFGPAIKEYLTQAEDLVVFSDEAHHIGNGGFGAWRSAVSQLRPKLHLGFTATVPKGAEKKIVFSCGLKACLREAKYTKAVKLWVEPKPDDIEDDNWDNQTIDFGLRRLESKQAAIAEFRVTHPEFPDVTPVLLIAAKDIAHAERIALWLQKYRDLESDEIHVAHSGKKGPSAASAERAISSLVSIDRPGNRIKVVINVFQLSEGWDVTNVWVIAPLRAMATFTNAIQTIGRGLRLPAGRRTEIEEIDTLDVLCFGKDNFNTIVDQAIREFGEGPDGSSTVNIAKTGDHHIRATRPLTVAAVNKVSFAIPEVIRVPGEPQLDFTPQLTKGISSVVEVYDVGSGLFGTDDGAAARRDFDAVVRSATAHVLENLRFLDPVKHTKPVRIIIERVLEDLGGKPGMQIATDAVKLALGVMEAIKTRYQSIPSVYTAGTSAIQLTITDISVPVPIEFDELPNKTSINEWK